MDFLKETEYNGSKKGNSNIVITMELLRSLNKPEKLALTEHARQRLMERNIKISDIVRCIAIGEIIQQYEDDTPFPSCLVLGKTMQEKNLHVVVSTDGEWVYLITAYFPDTNKWGSDFKTRKEKTA